jgi:hypothetical protein
VFVVVKPLRLASLPTFIASQLLESKKRKKTLSCTSFMQDLEASSQQASSSYGDDCEGADDKISEEEEEETISDREMDNRLQQVDSAHDHRRADQEREIDADQMVGDLLNYNLFSIHFF